MLSFLKKKERFSASEKERMVAAIRSSELKTSGEIRVFIEAYCTMGDAYSRAQEVFKTLKMEKTHHRNGVLLYIALDERVLAIHCDSGVYEQTGKPYWIDQVSLLTKHFKEKHYVEGIENSICQIGDLLATFFPFEPGNKNELPDDIVFGDL
jgi:uncharacterized membrane protein